MIEATKAGVVGDGTTLNTATIQKGWVLIQFGHNDMPGKGPERETDAKTTFRENLVRYLAEARAIGAKPVFVTSLTRRNFNAQGNIDPNHLVPSLEGQGTPIPDPLTDYVEATKAVAAGWKVPLVDLNARSIEQVNQLGPEAAVAFDAKSKDPSKPDKTHLSAKARRKRPISLWRKFESRCRNWPGWFFRKFPAIAWPADRTGHPTVRNLANRTIAVRIVRSSSRFIL